MCSATSWPWPVAPCGRSHREPFAVLPAVFIPAFFYFVNLGALENVARGAGFNYKAFLLPMAIAFAVTGMSRAQTLVTDISEGYFDRLCLTPVRRSALLLGLMTADVVVIVALCVPVLAIGFAMGVRFATGPAGVLVFVGISALWGLAFTGFPYAVALKTGSPAAVERDLRGVLPAVLPERRGGPEAGPRGVVLDHCHLQPGDLSPRRAALARERGVAAGRARRGIGRTRRSPRTQPLLRAARAPRTHPPGRLTEPGATGRDG